MASHVVQHVKYSNFHNSIQYFILVIVLKKKLRNWNLAVFSWLNVKNNTTTKKKNKNKSLINEFISCHKVYMH